MGQRARRWRLFIDESGDFDGPRGAPVVGGFLIEDGSPALNGPRTRDALRRAAPWVRWPLHAWLLRRPVMHAVWARVASGAPEQAEAAAKALEACASGPFAAAVGRTRAGGEPSGEELDHLERRLRTEGADAWRALARLSDGVRAAVLEVVQAIAGEERVWLVAASETQPDEPLEAPAELPGPYIPMLATLLQRVADALLEVGGDHQVDVTPLTRGVVETAVGRRVPLHVRHVATAAADAVGATRTINSAGGSVRINPGLPARFDADVLPALVLADLAANSARYFLRRAFDPLGVVRAAIEDELGARTAFPGARGGHLAAAGAARRHVDAQRVGAAGGVGVGLTARPRDRRWAVEQAGVWAGIVRERSQGERA